MPAQQFHTSYGISTGSDRDITTIATAHVIARLGPPRRPAIATTVMIEATLTRPIVAISAVPPR